jgi:hypothetical protein
MKIDDFRAKRIFNSYDLMTRYAADTGNVGVFISYQGRPSGRMGIGTIPGWRVVRPGYKTDPQAHWSLNGCRVFTQFEHSYNKDAALAAAKNWAGDRYNIADWEKVPGFGGDWFPKGALEWAKALLKGAVADGTHNHG